MKKLEIIGATAINSLERVSEEALIILINLLIVYARSLGRIDDKNFKSFSFVSFRSSSTINLQFNHELIKATCNALCLSDYHYIFFKNMGMGSRGHKELYCLNHRVSDQYIFSFKHINSV